MQLISFSELEGQEDVLDIIHALEVHALDVHFWNAAVYLELGQSLDHLVH